MEKTKTNKLNWSEQQKPKSGISHYDNVTLDTPLGQFMIEWKGWKSNESDFSIMLDDKYLGAEVSLEYAKEYVEQFIVKSIAELNEFAQKHNLI